MCSSLIKDDEFGIWCEEGSVDTELDDTTHKSDDECTLVFETFFANDLNAAAKDDACGAWLVSVSFKEEELFEADTVVGMGVSQRLVDREWWPFIDGIFRVGGVGFKIEDVANEGIFVCSFAEDTHVGNPIKRKQKYVN